ncbi:GNAT family N-acetyltransferase [Flavihumibacter petaseus]|uniref:Putative acetyltransferase n=1 Tax=Flavihumibacter petaseus NBRC 106054 TaxID=1220578 RepID=A0A0E9N0B1_9BACT|nr:GNAT family N-acetyltransferase [Flavihumibacter petaseus]GAO43289.1 putative acetyltransferase [Flavihumibacter petaseus NBRC 106054]
MSLRVRPILPEDNAVLAGIIRAALAEFGADKPGTVYFDPTTDHLFELFRQPRSAYFVAEEPDGRLLGGAGIFPTESLPEGCCELVKMYLTPAARGKGTGGTLVTHCLKEASMLGYREVYLETMPELKKALSMYEKFGFRYLKAPMGNSGHFGCGLWMLKNLDDQEASSTS